MGCNCGKGKAKPLNNLDSSDHLSLASDTYKSIISQKTTSEMDEVDKMEIIRVYMSLYPNQKLQPTLENAIHYVTEAHYKYTSK